MICLMTVEHRELPVPTAMEKAAVRVRRTLQDVRKMKGSTPEWRHRVGLAISNLTKDEGQDHEDSEKEKESALEVRDNIYRLLKRARMPTRDERKILEPHFDLFFVDRLTLGERIAKKPGHFPSDDLAYFTRMGESDLRDYCPPVETIIAVHRTDLFLQRSFGQSLTTQLNRTEDDSKEEVEPHLEGIKKVLLPATFWAAADMECADRNDGRGLFPADSFTAVLDDPSSSYRTAVGRLDPDGPFLASERHGGIHVPHIGAATALIFFRPQRI